jgi:hypothetical protein
MRINKTLLIDIALSVVVIGSVVLFYLLPLCIVWLCYRAACIVIDAVKSIKCIAHWLT